MNFRIVKSKSKPKKKRDLEEGVVLVGRFDRECSLKALGLGVARAIFNFLMRTVNGYCIDWNSFY